MSRVIPNQVLIQDVECFVYEGSIPYSIFAVRWTKLYPIVTSKVALNPFEINGYRVVEQKTFQKYLYGLVHWLRNTLFTNYLYPRPFGHHFSL